MFYEDNMTHENYVDYPCAQLLKTAGFDWECDHYYESTESALPKESTIGALTWRVSDYWFNFNEYDREGHRQTGNPKYSAPTLAQAAKWLREVKGLSINISAHDRGCYSWSVVFLPNADDYDRIPRFDSAFYDTYEQCLSVALNAALEMITSNTERK